jgi:hypothetical protein
LRESVKWDLHHYAKSVYERRRKDGSDNGQQQKFKTNLKKIKSNPHNAFASSKSKQHSKKITHRRNFIKNIYYILYIKTAYSTNISPIGVVKKKKKKKKKGSLEVFFVAVP